MKLLQRKGKAGLSLLLAALLLAVAWGLVPLRAQAASPNTQAVLDQLALLQNSDIDPAWTPDIRANEGAVQRLLDLYQACSAEERAEFTEAQQNDLRAYFEALYRVQGKDPAEVEALFAPLPASEAAAPSALSRPEASLAAGEESGAAVSEEAAASVEEEENPPAASGAGGGVGQVSLAESAAGAAPPQPERGRSLADLLGNSALGTLMLVVLLTCLVLVTLRFYTLMRRTKPEAGAALPEAPEEQELDKEAEAPPVERPAEETDELGQAKGVGAAPPLPGKRKRAEKPGARGKNSPGSSRAAAPARPAKPVAQSAAEVLAAHRQAQGEKPEAAEVQTAGKPAAGNTPAAQPERRHLDITIPARGGAEAAPPKAKAEEAAASGRGAPDEKEPARERQKDEAVPGKTKPDTAGARMTAEAAAEAGDFGKEAPPPAPQAMKRPQEPPERKTEEPARPEPAAAPAGTGARPVAALNRGAQKPGRYNRAGGKDARQAEHGPNGAKRMAGPPARKPAEAAQLAELRNEVFSAPLPDLFPTADRPAVPRQDPRIAQLKSSMFPGKMPDLFPSGQGADAPRPAPAKAPSAGGKPVRRRRPSGLTGASFQAVEPEEPEE